MTRDISPRVSGFQAEVLDHAREFVDVVQARAPGRYRELLEAPRFRKLLAKENALNHGQLFVYAEYLVFRSEFRQRFTGASAAACINAFCRLFLKNDISVTNLVRACEADTEKDLRYLRGTRNPAEDAEPG